MGSGFSRWAKYEYMRFLDYFDFMNEQNAFIDSQPNKTEPRPITASQVYIAPSSFQNFNQKNKSEKFDISIYLHMKGRDTDYITVKA